MSLGFAPSLSLSIYLSMFITNPFRTLFPSIPAFIPLDCLVVLVYFSNYTTLHRLCMISLYIYVYICMYYVCICTISVIIFHKLKTYDRMNKRSWSILLLAKLLCFCWLTNMLRSLTPCLTVKRIWILYGISLLHPHIHVCLLYLVLKLIRQTRILTHTNLPF